MLAPAGFLSLGIMAGLDTCFVFFIGAWVGAPVGLLLGALRGRCTPLRDTTITFVLYSALFWIACVQLGHSGGSNDNDNYLLRMGSWGLALGPGVFVLARLPGLLLSFDNRRVLALVSAVLRMIGIAVWTYLSLSAWTA